MRKIKAVVRAETIDMGGIKVDQALPSRFHEYHDPFLLIHHGLNQLPGGNAQKEVGVGPHPHRGFSPVTFVFQGDVHHRDSRGNSQVVGEGGMQWMSAGMGVIHSERPSVELADKGGTMEIIQIWVNTPQAHKMNEPYYLPIQKEDTPTLEKEGVKIMAYSGELEGLKGPAKVPYPISMIRMDFEKGSEYSMMSAEDENLLIYVLNGSLEINGRSVGPKSMLLFEQDGSSLELKASEDSQLIYLSGKPLEEPVSTYGPYVMNTQTELLEAMRDYQKGKMGILIEEFE